MKTRKYYKFFPGHTEGNIYLLTYELMFQGEIIAKVLCDRESVQTQRCDRIPKLQPGHREMSEAL